jgi:hypothetical protein
MKAGVVGDGLMPAVIALIAMSTKRSRAAARNGIKHLDLWVGQGLSVTI